MPRQCRCPGCLSTSIGKRQSGRFPLPSASILLKVFDPPSRLFAEILSILLILSKTLPLFRRSLRFFVSSLLRFFWWLLNNMSRNVRNVRGGIGAFGVEPRKPTVADGRLRRPVARPWRRRGERVPHPPPRPRHSPFGALPAAVGHESPPSRRDTKTAAARSARKEMATPVSC